MNIARRVAPAGAALALLGGGGGLAAGTAVAGSTSCSTTFKVLHDDKAGNAKLPRGSYRITSSTLTCSAATADFKLFLAKYPNRIPGWKATILGTGHARYERVSNGQNFTVRRIG